MSVAGSKGVGLPIILLHDAEGSVVTVELKDGSTYRGTLEDSQDNMNCTLKDCIKTSPEGKEIRVEIAYIRGSQVKFIVVPPILQRAPFFNRIKLWRKYKGRMLFGGGGMIGRGQNTIVMSKPNQRKSTPAVIPVQPLQLPPEVAGFGGGGGRGAGAPMMYGGPQYPGPGGRVGPPVGFPMQHQQHQHQHQQQQHHMGVGYGPGPGPGSYAHPRGPPPQFPPPPRGGYGR